MKIKLYVVLMVLALSACNSAETEGHSDGDAHEAEGGAGHKDEKGHGHDDEKGHAEGETHDEAEGHTEGDKHEAKGGEEAGHAEEGEHAEAMKLTPEARKTAGLVIAAAGRPRWSRPCRCTAWSSPMPSACAASPRAFPAWCAA